MKYFLVILIIFLTVNKQFAASSLQMKYPDGLLTDDYGILQEADLLFDIKNGNPRKYNISEMQSGYYRWQCFKVEDVKFKYSTWRAPDPMGAFNIIVWMCDFSFTVKNQGISHFYYDRRARRIEFCRAYASDWKKIKSGQKFVCLNGEPESLTNNQKAWTWNKLKSKNGCTSLFEGDCETALPAK